MHHGLVVSYHSSDRAVAEVIFKGRYQNKRDSLFTYEFGTAVCNTTRYGNSTWGLFDPLKLTEVAAQ